MTLKHLTDIANKNIEELDVRSSFLANCVKNSEDVEAVEKALTILSSLKQLGLSNNHMNEFFKGAHFTIADNGNLYNSLKVLGYERISSHYPSEKPQSDVGIKAGNIFEQFLVGTTGEKTWFQIESSAMPNILDIFSDYEALNSFISHSIDFAIYVGSGKTINIGQYGTSSFTEFNPIIVDLPVENEFLSGELSGNSLDDFSHIV